MTFNQLLIKRNSRPSVSQPVVPLRMPFPGQFRIFRICFTKALICLVCFPYARRPAVYPRNLATSLEVERSPFKITAVPLQGFIVMLSPAICLCEPSEYPGVFCAILVFSLKHCKLFNGQIIIIVGSEELCILVSQSS